MYHIYSKKPQKNNGAKAPITSDYDASAPKRFGFSKARTNIPVSSMFILLDFIIFFNNKIVVSD